MTDGPGDWSHGPEWVEPGADPEGLTSSGFDIGHEHDALPYDDPHDPHDPAVELTHEQGWPGADHDDLAEPAAAPGTGHEAPVGEHEPYEVHEPGAEPGNPDQTDLSLVDSLESAGPPDALLFPPELHLDVTPSDGQPWVDPGLLGADPDGGHLVQTEDPPEPVDSPDALLADLHAADGGDGPVSASTLGGSDDPAIRTLAAYWSR